MGQVDGTSALALKQRFNLATWRTWPEIERWELINGEAYNMSPAPRVAHQQVALDLGYRLSEFMEGKPCQPFIAPVDVFLPSSDGEQNEASDTVVQPDVFVVCNPSTIEEDGIHGTPDFVVEILSDSTAYKDTGVKKLLYERSGVQEYWIVHPLTKSVSVYKLVAGAYGQGLEYLEGMEIPSTALPGFVWRCR